MHALDQFTDQIAAFKTDGFCVFRKLLTDAEVSDQRQHLDAFMRDILPTVARGRAMYQDKRDPRSVFRIEYMGEYDPYYDAQAARADFAELAARLLDDQALPYQLSMFGKAPRIGRATPPHQDGNYFMLEPNHALTFWIPIDTADLENGCVRYVRGSHLGGLRPHALGDEFGFSLGLTEYSDADTAAEVPVCVEPGDVIAHHSLTIHRTDPNPSDRLRRALGHVFVAASAQPNLEARAAHAARVHEHWRATGKL